MHNKTEVYKQSIIVHLMWWRWIRDGFISLCFLSAFVQIQYSTGIKQKIKMMNPVWKRHGWDSNRSNHSNFMY